MSDFSDRIKQAMKKVGISQSELARAVEVTPTTIKNWMEGATSKMKYTDVMELSRVLHVHPNWLMEGDADEHLESLTPVRSRKSDDFVYLKRLDIKASCGRHACAVDYVDEKALVDVIKAGAVWFKTNFPHYSPDSIRIVTASGDSMSPLIEDGDLVFIDCRQNACQIDGVYFLLLDGQFFIKRVQRTTKRGLLLISENQRYRDIELPAESQLEFKVLGKVIKTFKSIDL